MRSADVASVDTGRSLFKGSSGKWAGERWLAEIKATGEMTTEALRTLDTLQRDEWVAFDTALVEEAQIRLRAVQDLINAGLVVTLPNGLGTTVFEWEKMTDMEEAIVSMDGVVRSENDRVEFSPDYLPLPITHKDWNINLRTLMASRKRGTALDVTNARIAGRKIAEKTEDMLFNGGRQFAGMKIYGYLTHPNRNIVPFGTGGAWSGSKTGDQIFSDVESMITAAHADRMWGPYVLYVPTASGLYINRDYKSATSGTIRARLLEIPELMDIRGVDSLPADNLVLVQMTSDVVQMVSAEPLQNVQWDINGGFEIAFKGFQIMIPLIRTDSAGRSGIVHLS